MFEYLAHVKRNRVFSVLQIGVNLNATNTFYSLLIIFFTESV